MDSDTSAFLTTKYEKKEKECSHEFSSQVCGYIWCKFCGIKKVADVTIGHKYQIIEKKDFYEKIYYKLICTSCGRWITVS